MRSVIGSIENDALILCSSFCSFAIPTAMLAQKSDEVASPSCWGTDGRFHSRAVKTRVFRSDAGVAYAEVSAKAITDGDVRNCSNTARLFYSTSGGDPKVIWSGRQDLNGLGVTIFGWSKAGTLLLFQTRTWPYDSDADEVHRGLVFDSATGRVRDLKLTSAFTASFGSKCEFEQTVLRWESDHSVRVRISRTPLTDHYKQVFCVKVPVDYMFDLSTSTATRVR
jgi:hypothetical protein